MEPIQRNTPEWRELRKAQNAEWRRARLAKGKMNPNIIPHGTPGGYSNWGCHCAECRAAVAAKGRMIYHRRKGNVPVVWATSKPISA